jgi:2-keto-4-pentenoate hydratase/2-oxohepta-3-ene-1,7-dioic acid hydratase in catechol pathway
MLALIEAGPEALREAARLAATGESLALADVRLLAPVPVPAQMRDCSVFAGHLQNAPLGMARVAARLRGEEVAGQPLGTPAPLPAIYRERPIYYLTNRFAVSGPGSVVDWPRYSKLMDYELEFGIFIGQSGRNISAADAGRHIFGYTVYNDFSARDMQCIEMQGYFGPAKGKSFDGGNVMGPWIVTPDEIPDPYNLGMRAYVNGRKVSEGSSADMLHRFEDIIAYLSQDETLHPGEFIGSGTLGGGCGLERDEWLQDGDEVIAEIDYIGSLSARVRVQGG